jgi:hypothetical protein
LAKLDNKTLQLKENLKSMLGIDCSILLEQKCPNYMQNISLAFFSEFPSFLSESYKDIFLEEAKDYIWVVQFIISNIETKKILADRAWKFAAEIKELEHKNNFKQHAVNCCHDILTNISILELFFSSIIDSSFLSELKKLSPNYTIVQQLPTSDNSLDINNVNFDSVVELNLLLIRFTIRNSYLKIALNSFHTSKDKVESNQKFEKITEHETAFILASANIIEDWIIFNSSSDNTTNILKIITTTIINITKESIEEPIDFEYNIRFGNYP